MRMLKIYTITGALLASTTAMAQQPDTLKNKTLREIEILSATATRTSIGKLDVPVRSLPATINTVDAETLQLQGVDDMLTALRNVEGVRPVSTYGAFQHYVIRGFNDFLMLVDGFRDERQNIATSATMTNLAAVYRSTERPWRRHVWTFRHWRYYQCCQKTTDCNARI
jgi:iron complex outermembrane receptor protein